MVYIGAMQDLGCQLLADFYDCRCDKIDSVDFVREVLLEAAIAGELTVVGECFHHFSPQGVSGVLIVAESHVSVHTWPEHGYVAVDIFTCGPAGNMDAMHEIFVKNFQAESSSKSEVRRGLLPPVGATAEGGKTTEELQQP